MIAIATKKESELKAPFLFLWRSRKYKVPTIYKIGFDNSAGSSHRSAQPSMAERSRSHVTWYCNLVPLPYLKKLCG